LDRERVAMIGIIIDVAITAWLVAIWLNL